MFPFLEQNKDLLKYSSFHTPAIARYFFELREHSDIPKLHDIWKWSKEEGLPVVFLGSGTNMVFAFNVFEGVIIRNMLKGIEWYDGKVRAGAGELISPLSLQVSKVRENSLFGKWIGLPGTIGGAVAGNAGCFGFETKDAILEATIFDTITGETRAVGVDELDFSYRHSILKDTPHWCILDATFKTNLVSDDTTDPRTFRSGKQPGGFTCGSFFRNPVGDSAGRLIDQVGLKGYRIGGVKISELHANFFVNDENGSYEDILTLRDIAKQKVRDTFSIELQEEARILENR
ncbi:MAG: UDP-N-acetylmuramate dehydrogenase [Candidatus Gracilibacteria bacterium]|nr:UDP-N-acetylmuramate dehydrogenase [Candidatus Gracilibacteria bacterium]